MLKQEKPNKKKREAPYALLGNINLREENEEEGLNMRRPHTDP